MRTQFSNDRLTIEVGDHDHVQGPASAPVTLVEYGDYQCPYCGQAYPIVKRLQSEMGDKLRFVFRNFPLTQVHEHAEHAAEAAEAAAAQGKFWEMHDALYENQKNLSDDHIVQLASKVGIDAKQVTDALGAHTYRQKVREDFIGGVHSGVNGTPSFFINGVRHDESYDYETLRAAILAKAK